MYWSNWHSCLLCRLYDRGEGGLVVTTRVHGRHEGHSSTAKTVDVEEQACVHEVNPLESL